MTKTAKKEVLKQRMDQVAKYMHHSGMTLSEYSDGWYELLQQIQRDLIRLGAKSPKMFMVQVHEASCQIHELLMQFQCLNWELEAIARIDTLNE